MSEKLKSWLKRPQTIAWVICGIIAVLVFGILLWVQGCDTDSGAIRNYIFGLGGVGALLGVWLASIRGSDFTRQVDEQTKQINLLAEQVKTQTRQTELQTQQVRSEILSQCIERIGHEKSSAIRTAGIHGLEILAQDHQNDVRFLQHLCDILQGFVNEHAPSREDDNSYDTLKYLRNIKGSFTSFLKDLKEKASSQKEGLTEREEKILAWDKKWRDRKAEVEQAIHSFDHIARRASHSFDHITRRESENLSKLDLSFRYLPGLEIGKPRDMNPASPPTASTPLYLRGVNLFFSFLPGAKLWDADLRKADLRYTNLKEAALWDTNLEKRFLESTNLSGAKFALVYLKEAVLFETDLMGAQVGQEDLREALLVKTDLRGANLTGAKMQKTRFYKTQLKDADFAGANLAGAVHYENRADYLKDRDNNPPQLGKRVTKEWLKAQEVENWNKAKGIADR